MRLLLTGTPGCGKTTLAKKIAKKLKAKLVDVTALVESHGIYSVNSRKEKVVDLRKLQKILKPIVAKEKNVVVESHLLCEIPLECDRIVVLRCEPLALKKRLEKRGYPAWKVKENVMAEMLDYCSIKASENYEEGKIVEIDFTMPLSPGKVLAKRKGDRVNWMPEFAKIREKLKGFLD